MDFFTTKYINELIKEEYLAFISRYYMDILSNSNKYISLVENEISKYLWGWYVKLLNSWTTVLQFWLLILWVWEWDEVILPANTYSATAIAITNIWAIPVFCDINLDNYSINTQDLERKITPRTKVVIPVHLYWYACCMNKIISIAKKYNIKVLEDASHAFGWEYWWRKLWTIWNIWAFSCHLSKNFWTFGNWGIFYTKDKKLFDIINNYIYPDIPNKEVLKSLRTPANIWVIDALVLLFKLKYINKVIDNNLVLYKSYLKKYKEEWFKFPKLDLEKNKLHIRNFIVLCNNEYKYKYIEKWLWKQYYDIDLSKSNSFKIFNNGKLINTEKFFRENLWINFYFWKKIYNG